MISCPQCGTQIAPSLLSCPSCRWLVHGAALAQLAREADAATQRNDPSAALAAWRRMLDLLPPDARQRAVIAARIDAASRRLDGQHPSPATATPSPTRPRMKGSLAAGIGAAIVFLLTKAKLLLLGLANAGTLLSMLVSFGVYWTAWGWRFALGVVVSIYIHEMGHVAALRRYGLKASPPMFIPGIGAFVHMKQPPLSSREDARVGMAGPWWGLATALAAGAVFLATRQLFWAALAEVGGWLTLFNLTPVWQLDGSRAFHALSKRQQWIAALVFGALWAWTHEGLLILITVVAVVRALQHAAPVDDDRGALAQYVTLAVAAASLCLINVPMR